MWSQPTPTTFKASKSYSRKCFAMKSVVQKFLQGSVETWIYSLHKHLEKREVPEKNYWNALYTFFFFLIKKSRKWLIPRWSTWKCFLEEFISTGPICIQVSVLHWTYPSFSYFIDWVNKEYTLSSARETARSPQRAVTAEWNLKPLSYISSTAANVSYSVWYIGSPMVFWKINFKYYVTVSLIM